MIRSHRAARRVALTLCAATSVALAFGCGGSEDGPQSSGGPLDAPADPRQVAVRTDGEENRPPSIQSVRLEPREPVAGLPVRAVVSAHDPDGDPIEVGYDWLVNGRKVRGSGPQMTFGELRSGDTVSVRVIASDGRGQSEAREATGRAGNRPPQIEDLVIHTTKGDDGESVWLVEPIASDPDGDRIDFDITWTSGTRVVGRDETLRRGSWKRGEEIVVTVVARDQEHESAPLESAPIVIGNAAPDIVSKPPGLDPSGQFRYQIDATDPDGDRGLRYSLGEAPDGMEVDPFGGLVTWSATVDDEGEHKIEVIVDDRNGSTTKQVFFLTVTTKRTTSPASPR